jgi:hypothetical protein
MSSGASPCCIGGYAIASGLTGIFVRAAIAATHIVNHSGAYTIGINSTLRAVFIFFTGSKQANCCQSC